jgi:AcrR family transcriptional regulator
VAETGKTWGGLTGAERRDRRFQQLLDAGLEVFGTRGWAGTTVRDVCVQARLSQRYFYEHFDRREACFLAVLDRIAEEVEVAVRDAVATPGTPQDRAEATLTGLADLFAADPRKLRVAFVESFATPTFRARRAELLHAFAALASRLMAALHPHPERADQRSLELSAFILSGGIAEAFVHVVDGDLALPTEVLVAQLRDLYAQAAAMATLPA